MMSENPVDNATKQNENSPDAPKKRSFFFTSLPFFIVAHGAHHLLTALPQPMLPYNAAGVQTELCQVSRYNFCLFIIRRSVTASGRMDG